MTYSEILQLKVKIETRNKELDDLYEIAEDDHDYQYLREQEDLLDGLRREYDYVWGKFQAERLAEDIAEGLVAPPQAKTIIRVIGSQVQTPEAKKARRQDACRRAWVTRKARKLADQDSIQRQVDDLDFSFGLIPPGLLYQ